MSKRGVEEELQRCQDKLRAVQVERNLLLVSVHVHVHVVTVHSVLVEHMLFMYNQSVM